MGTNLYNVYEEYEEYDFYRFFNGFDAETCDMAYGPELDASIWFRTNDYNNDAAELFFYCFEHYKAQGKSDKERYRFSKQSTGLMNEWPEKHLQEIVSVFEEEWKSFVESLGTKNYKTFAKLKKFAKELKSKYKRDKDGNWNLKSCCEAACRCHDSHLSFPVTVTENDIIISFALF